MHPHTDKNPAPKPSTEAAPAKPADVAGEDAHIVEAADEEDLRQDKPKTTDEQLDHGLKETFPASDPVSINPGAD
jgi:hypothetical protein